MVWWDLSLVLFCIMTIELIGFSLFLLAEWLDPQFWGGFRSPYIWLACWGLGFEWCPNCRWWYPASRRKWIDTRPASGYINVHRAVQVQNVYEEIVQFISRLSVLTSTWMLGIWEENLYVLFCYEFSTVTKKPAFNLFGYSPWTCLEAEIFFFCMGDAKRNLWEDNLKVSSIFGAQFGIG